MKEHTNRDNSGYGYKTYQDSDNKTKDFKTKKEHKNFKDNEPKFSSHNEETQFKPKKENLDSTAQDVVYGRHPVMEALRSNRPIQRLYVLAQASGLPRELFGMARSAAIPVVHTSRANLDGMANRGNHQGVVALVGVRDFASLDELLEIPYLKGEKPLFLVLDSVQDPGNFGAILRSCEGAGVHGVIVPADGSCGLTGTVSRASAGADEYVCVARVPKLGPVMRKFKEEGYTVVATVPNAPQNYTEVDYTQPTVILMGAEGRGIRPSLLDASTHKVSIPLLGKVQSLNVSVSSALFMYEAVRQRRLKANITEQ